MSNSQAVPRLHHSSSSHPRGPLTMPPSHLQNNVSSKKEETKVYFRLIIHKTEKPNAYLPRRIEEFGEAPALGEDGGERNVVEEPARRAEYRTERTVVSMPRMRVLAVTALDLLSPLHT